MLSRRQALGQIVTAVAVLALPRSLKASRRDSFPHPDPRPGITGKDVLEESLLGRSKSVKEGYAAARAHPEIFDALYCVCECDKNMKHRSLLACFESTQAVGCRSCREQARLVATMREEGRSLAEIRKAFDKKWG